jgi:hypothetical protein
MDTLQKINSATANGRRRIMVMLDTGWFLAQTNWNVPYDG